jgi:hypothetical protein
MFHEDARLEGLTRETRAMLQKDLLGKQVPEKQFVVQQPFPVITTGPRGRDQGDTGYPHAGPIAAITVPPFATTGRDRT